MNHFTTTFVWLGQQLCRVGSPVRVIGPCEMLKQFGPLVNVEAVEFLRKLVQLFVGSTLQSRVEELRRRTIVVLCQGEAGQQCIGPCRISVHRRSAGNDWRYLSFIQSRRDTFADDGFIGWLIRLHQMLQKDILNGRITNIQNLFPHFCICCRTVTFVEKQQSSGDRIDRDRC